MTENRWVEWRWSLWQRSIGGLVLLSTAIGLLVLGPTWYMLEVYDRVVISRNDTTLVFLSLGVLLLIALLELFEWHRSELLRILAAALDQAMADTVAARAFERVRQHGVASGEQALRALQSVRSFLLSPVLPGLLDLPMALFFLCLLWMIHPSLSVVALGAAALQMLSAWWQDHRNASVNTELARMGASAQAVAQRAFEQAPTWQALGMLSALYGRWAQVQQRADVLASEVTQRRAAHQAFSRWLQQSIGSVLLGMACWMLLDDQLAGGPVMLIVASLLGARVVAPLVQVIAHGAAFSQAREAWQTLSALLADDGPEQAKLALPPPTGHLTVEQLAIVPDGVAAGQRAPLLRGVQFQLKPGEMLVVLGPSGAGKTTLARALTGVLQPAAGSVRLDGAEVSGWSHEALGKHIGYLPQNVALLDGSLRDNVARFGSVDTQLLEQALSDAALLPFVQTLPEGLNTEIGDGGTHLSGGWRQRVGLARALYGRPAFLVFDEPNASLDRDGDGALEQVLRQLKARGSTVVVMSHRASLVRLADHLLVLRDGQQLAFGPRDEVMAAIRAAGQPPAPALKGLAQ